MASRKINNWKQINQQWVKGIRAICYESNPSPESNLLKTILSAADKITIGDDIQSATTWIESVVDLIQSTSPHIPLEIVEESISTVRTPQFYVRALSALSKIEAPKMLAAAIVSSGSTQSNAIIEIFASKCRDGSFSFDEANGINLIAQIKNDWPWISLSALANERLRSQGITVPQASAFTYLVLILNRSEIQGTEATLNSLATGTLFHYLWVCSQNKQWDQAYHFFYAILLLNPAGTMREQVGNSHAGTGIYNNICANPNNWGQLMEKTAGLVAKFGTLENLIIKAENTPQIANSVTTLVKELEKRPDAIAEIKSQFILQRYEALEKILGKENFKTLMESLACVKTFIKDLTLSNFDEKAAVLYAVIISKADEFQKNSVLIFVGKGLQSASKNKWKNELETNGSLLTLTVMAVKSGLEVSLGADFHDALLENAKGLIQPDKSKKPNLDREIADVLINAMKPEFRETFLRNLRDYLIDHAELNIRNMLVVYGERLISSQVLVEEHKEDEIVRRLLTEIVKRKDQFELIWVEKALTSSILLSQESFPASKDALIAQISPEKIADPENREILTRIASILSKKN